MRKINKFWQIKNESDEQAELLLYGEINADAKLYQELFGDDTMTSAKMLADDLKALGGKKLMLRINSPGGDVFQAQAMYNLLKGYSGAVECHIDGICASAATLVACAASKITMPENSLFMIHNPSANLCGMVDAGGLARMQSMLEKTRDTILAVYSERVGERCTAEKLGELMDAESWLSASEAADYGFVDEVEDYGVAASLTGDVLTIGGVAMPSIKNHQQEILTRMTRKKVVNNMGENLIAELAAKVKDMLGKEGAPVDAVAAEKARVAALDALKGDNAYANALIETAKAQNATAESLKPYIEAVTAVKPENKGIEELAMLIRDQLTSGASGVQAQPQVIDDAQTAAQARQASIDEIVAIANGKRG